jgi:hypothetical protein
MLKKALALLCFIAVLATPWAVFAEDEKIPPEAQQVADRLLEMLDAGKLKETFVLASDSIKKTDTEALWFGHMESWRGSMGAVKSRKLVGAVIVDKFADRPTGKYLKITFDTEFAAYPKTQEIVVLTEEDGKWGVADYQAQYNRWPEALKIIGNGLFLVFFIMGLLATVTYVIGRAIQSGEKRKKAVKEGA